MSAYAVGATAPAASVAVGVAKSGDVVTAGAAVTAAGIGSVAGKVDVNIAGAEKALAEARSALKKPYEDAKAAALDAKAKAEEVYGKVKSVTTEDLKAVAQGLGAKERDKKHQTRLSPCRARDASAAEWCVFEPRR